MGSVNIPTPRSYAQETSDTLATQIGLAPALYNAEATYQPQYNVLNLQNYQDYLNGTKAGQRTSTYTTPEQSLSMEDAYNRGYVTSKKASKAQLTDLGKTSGFNISGGAIIKPSSTETKTYDVPEQQGLLAMYENSVYPTLSRIEAQDAEARRAADLGAIQKYGQQYVDALKAANPQQAALIDEMNKQAMQGLQAGQGLTPQETRAAQQAARAAFAARGMATGNQAIASEILNNYNLGASREAQRRQFAGQVFGMNQASMGDPMLQILGRPSTLIQQGQGFGSQAQAGSQVGNLFNPESTYAGGIYNQNWQGKLQANIANASNSWGALGGGLQAFGHIGGGLLGNSKLFG